MARARIATAVSRLASEHAIAVVLLLLAAFFSAVTYKEQNPRGADAGEGLAKAILAGAGGRPARVIVLASDTAEQREFARALARRLEEGGAAVLRSAIGDPPALRRALEEIAARGEDVDVIACSRSVASLGFVAGLGRQIPALAGARVAVPESYFWPDFLKTSNLRAVAIRVAVVAIIAIGMTCVIITAGIDLSVGSLIALSAVIATLLIRDAAGARNASALGMTLSCLAAVIACAAMGAFSGLMVTAFDIPPFIATLAMMQIASGLAYILSDSQSIYQLPDSFTWLGRGSMAGIPNAVLLMGLLYIAAHVMMTRTVFGRYIYAVGGNREAARLSGVPVRLVLLVCYTLCGALAGVGGIIRASELKSGEPNYGFMAELDVIAAVVVGGTSLSGGEGKIAGTLLGALIIAVIRNGMNLTNVESNVQRVVLGLVILGAVLADILKRRGWRVWRWNTAAP